jgi:hypothetical protein
MKYKLILLFQTLKLILFIQDLSLAKVKKATHQRSEHLDK